LELVVSDERPVTRAVLSGELVAPAQDLARRFTDSFVARPQTQRTYGRACRRFVRWLGPMAGPADLTAANVAAYHAHLVGRRRSSATVKKERAALNTFLRWLVEHEELPARQAREALSVRLPRARAAEQREIPKHLSAEQYEGLIGQALAAIAKDLLAGARDVAIVLVLGDAGLRCAELQLLERRDFLAVRAGAHLRALAVRHGKGDRQRRVTLSKRATRAIVRWDRERIQAFGPEADDAPLFITLGRRRRDASYTRLGGPCGQPVLAAVLKRLGAAAQLPVELRHPHALRHTCATEMLRARGVTIADVRIFLGHASVKTTSIYLASDAGRQEQAVSALYITAAFTGLRQGGSRCAGGTSTSASSGSRFGATSPPVTRRVQSRAECAAPRWLTRSRECSRRSRATELHRVRGSCVLVGRRRQPRLMGTPPSLLPCARKRRPAPKRLS